MSRARKLQASLDFILTYGLAIAIITIVLIVIFRYGLNIGTTAFSAPTCSPAAGFSCVSFYVNSSGALYIDIGQATGGTMTVHGVACATLTGVNGTEPAFGNINVTGQSMFYPVASPAGTTIYSGGTQSFEMYCYNGGNYAIATGGVGNPFQGDVWLNYTVPGFNGIEEIASVSGRYS